MFVYLSRNTCNNYIKIWYTCKNYIKIAGNTAIAGSLWKTFIGVKGV